MTLYAFGSDWEAAPRTTPPGVTLFAIGDVHGHIAQLDALLVRLEERFAAVRAEGRAPKLLMIGDYIHRGPGSLAVLRRLATLDHEGLDLRCLLGNHDQYMLDFLFAPTPGATARDAWLFNGGVATLAELGFGRSELTSTEPVRLAAMLRQKLGPDVLAILGHLEAYVAVADWLFVHAGVHPARPLRDQTLAEWLRIREPFMSGTGWSHSYAVVHGHTIRGPEVLPHRIAIDSGCYRTGVLTAVELEGDRLRFHCASDRDDLGAFRSFQG